MLKRIIGIAGQRIPNFVSKISRQKLYRHGVKDNDLPLLYRSEMCSCFSGRFEEEAGRRFVLDWPVNRLKRGRIAAIRASAEVVSPAAISLSLPMKLRSSRVSQINSSAMV